MKKTTRKILIYILVAIFTAAIMGVAATNARYVSMPSPSTDSVISGNELQYTIAEQYEVTNQEELKTAISNGYTNIKIVSDEDEPFYVSSDDLELTEDLILDLNGHEIQCITREPIITVPTGKRLLVTDTSEGGTGSFYNPVGSVLNIDGGVLSASSGKYESGPRKSEYYSNSTNASVYTGGEILQGAEVSVNFQRDSTGAAYETTTSLTMPIIYPTGNSGNIYFDAAYTENNCDIPADTYLYYISEDTVSTLANKEKADFYYTYNLTYDGSVYSYDANGEIYVTVCGFYNDKALAANDVNDVSAYFDDNRTASNFAAIKMLSGNLYVRGGEFYSWFGVNSAYCISTTGGTTSVYDGTFEAIERGVCVRCNETDASTAANLNVSAGAFYSYHGNMIEVVGGEMTVTGGTFVKDATEYSGSQEGDNNSAIYIEGGEMTVTGTENNLVEFDIYGSYIDAIKCYKDANATDTPVITATYAKFNYNGGSSDSTYTGYESNVGIANYGGNITVENCLFDTNDDKSRGIKSESGTINANGSFFVLSGEESQGIYAEAGTVEVGTASNVSDTICVFYIDHVLNCYGIYAENDSTADINININAAQFIMGQEYYSTAAENTVPDVYTSASGTTWFNGAGIYLNATNGELVLKRAVFMMAGSYTAGVYAANGTITQDDEGSGYTSALLIGVTHSAYSGDGISTDASFAETRFGNNYFVATYGTSSTYAASSNFCSTNSSRAVAASSINALQFTDLSATGSAIGSYGIYSAGGTISADKVYVALCSTYGSGIYTTGGSMTINDFECDVRSTDSSSNAYPGKTAVTADVSSAAISSGTDGASATITIGDSNINTDAYGYNVKSGTLVFTGENSLNSVRATAIYVSGANLEINSAATLSVSSNIATQTGWTTTEAVKGGALLTDYTNLNYSSTSNTDTIQPDGIYVSGGSLISSGTLNVNFWGVNNDTDVDYFVDFVIKSYAVRVTGTATSTVTIAKGAVASSIGGGVEVSSSDSNVTLGVSGAANTTLTIETEGYGDYSTSNYTGANTFLSAYDSNRSFTTNNWKYYLYTQSGHAVKVDNGTLTINCGTYTAVQGNGIFVNGSSSNVYITDGIFLGNEKHLYTSILDGNNAEGSHLGPAISYAVKLFEGNLYITGGTFGTDGTDYSNGVFVMGNESGYDSQNNTYTCNAYFYGGTYDADTKRTIAAMGYCYMQIGGTYNGTSYSPTITGGTYGIGLEPFDNDAAYSYTGSFKMVSGTVTSTTQDGIWIGNTNYTVDIDGGTITGSESGINFYREFYGIVTIDSATISGYNGLKTSSQLSGNIAGTFFNNVTITNSTLYSTGAQYGIYFDTSVFGQTGYTFKIDSSTVYGGAGIRFATDTGSYGTFYITNGTKVRDTATAGGYGSWYGLEYSYSLSMALVIDGGSSVTGGTHAIYIGTNLAGSLTVDGSGTTVTGSQSALYITSTMSSGASITVSDSAVLKGNNSYCIYMNSFANGATITLWGNTSLVNGRNSKQIRVNGGNNNNRGTLICDSGNVTISTGNNNGTSYTG